MPQEKIKNDSNNTIGKNIRRIRKEKKIGQTALVRELQLIDVNMTRETLNRTWNSAYSTGTAKGNKKDSQCFI